MRGLFARLLGTPLALGAYVLAVHLLAVRFPELSSPAWFWPAVYLTGTCLGLVLTFLLARDLRRRLGVLRGRVVDFPGLAVASVTRRPADLGELETELESRFGRLRSEFEALRLEKRLLLSLLDALRDGVLCVDQAGVVLYRNPVIPEGLVRSGAVGRPYIRTIRSAELLQFIERFLRSDRPATAEPTMTSFRSQDRYFRATYVPVRLEGETAAELALFVIQDRTEEANVQRLREEFLANAEHELKTPITSIRGYAETLLGRKQEEPTRGFIEAILRNALRMERLVEDMATISAVESREHGFFPETIAVAEHLESTARLVRGALQGKSQQLRIDVSPDLRVRADPLLLEHLLLNLIANASRYGPEESTIRVSIAREEDRFRIQVADEGPGVPVEYRTKIFERFFRIDRDRSRKEGGTGLGLSIVRQIARMHGGRVWVEDAPEGGALFQVILKEPPVEPNRL